MMSPVLRSRALAALALCFAAASASAQSSRDSVKKTRPAPKPTPSTEDARTKATRDKAAAAGAAGSEFIGAMERMNQMVQVQEQLMPLNERLNAQHLDGCPPPERGASFADSAQHLRDEVTGATTRAAMTDEQLKQEVAKAQIPYLEAVRRNDTAAAARAYKEIAKASMALSQRAMNDRLGGTPFEITEDFETCTTTAEEVIAAKHPSKRMQFVLRAHCLGGSLRGRHSEADRAGRELFDLAKSWFGPGSDVEAFAHERVCFNSESTDRSASCEYLFRAPGRGERAMAVSRCAADKWITTSSSDANVAILDRIIEQNPGPTPAEMNLRGRAALKAILGSMLKEVDEPSVEHWQTVAAATLPRFGATEPEMTVIRSIHAKRSAAVAKSNGLIPTNPNTNPVAATLAQDGFVPQLVASDQYLTRMAAAADFPGVATAVPEMRLWTAAGLPFRVLYEIGNLGMLRGVDPEVSVRRLESETPLMLRYVRERCRDEGQACLSSYYPAVRASKGILAAALGSTVPISVSSLVSVSPEIEKQTADFVRQHAANGDFANLSASDSPLNKLLRGEIVDQVMRATDSLRSLDPGQRVLDPDDAFIDYYRYPQTESDGSTSQRYGAFISIADRPVVFVSLGMQDAADRAIDKWWNDVTTPGVAWASDEATLRSLVWDPVARFVPRTAKRLIIAPDGSLARIAWSVIASSDRAPARETSIVTSWNQYAYLRTTAAKKNTHRALVVQNLDYGAGSQFPHIETSPDVSGSLKAGGYSAATLTAAAATRDQIATESPKVDVVHVLTHGVATPATEATGATALRAMRDAQLALSGANGGGAATRLSAADLMKWDLSSVNLLVLAACSSGAGTIMDGQGVLGFQMAAAAAGARASLVSLWPAPDGAATTKLLEAFYAGVFTNHLSPSAALARAQKQVRETPDLEDPVYWAGWTIVGEGWSVLR